jgi:ribonuclease HII
VDEAGRGRWPARCSRPPSSSILRGRSKACAIRKTQRSQARHAGAADQGRLAWAIAEASEEEIDKLNILQASMLAMRRAVEALSTVPTLALIDGNRCPVMKIQSIAIVGGDDKVEAISAASILAKTARDAALVTLHAQYPQYCFDQHKGYGTALHLARLREHGAVAGASPFVRAGARVLGEAYEDDHLARQRAIQGTGQAGRQPAGAPQGRPHAARRRAPVPILPAAARPAGAVRGERKLAAESGSDGHHRQAGSAARPRAGLAGCAVQRRQPGRTRRRRDVPDRHAGARGDGAGERLGRAAGRRAGPGNVGSILRSAAAAGIKQVYCSAGTAFCWSPKVLRAAMGAHFVLDIFENVDLAELVRNAKVQTLATSGYATQRLYDVDLRQPTAWLFGHEGQGVADDLLSPPPTRS